MSDTFQFDEVDFFRKFQEEVSRVNETEKNLTRAQQNEVKIANESAEALQSSVQGLSARSSQVQNEALEALQQLENIQQIPQGFRKIIGFFDTDFNDDALRIRASRANLKLQGVNTQLKNAQTVHRLNLERAAAGTETATQQVVSQRRQLQDTADLLNLGIKVEDEAREEDIEAAQDLSQEQLIEIRENLKAGNLDAVPEGLRDKPGLIQSVIQDKQLKSLGVDSSQIANARAAIGLEQEKTARDLERFSDDELNNFASTGTFPGGLTDSIVASEVRRREGQKLALRDAQTAVKKGDIELSRIKKAEVLQSSTLEELQAAQESASVSPLGASDVSRGGFKTNFTIEELNQAVLLKQEARRKNIDLLVERSTGIAVAESKAITNSLKINNLSKQLSPGGTFDPSDPISSAPPEALELLSENSASVKELENILVNLDPKDTASKGAVVEAIAKEQLKLEEKIDQVNKGILENTPAPEKAAASEFLNQGKVTNTENAASHLASTASNPEALNHSRVMNGPWQAFSEEFLEQAAISSGTKISTDPVTGNFDLSSISKTDEANIVNKAMKNIGFRDGVADNLLQKTLAEAIITLAAGSRDDKGRSPLDGIVNPSTGLFNPEFYVENPPGSGNLVFNAQAFNIGLSKKSVELRKEGILDKHERLQDLIYDHTRMMTADIGYNNRNFGGNSAEASVSAMAFNNNPGVFIRRKLQGLEQNVVAAEKAEAELQTQLQAEILAIQESAQGDPNLGGLSVPIPEENAPKSIFELLRKQQGFQQ